MGDKDTLKDYSSPYNFHVRNDKLIREYQISLENMNLIRKDLAHCIRTEGVNQFVNCEELRMQYFELCQDRFRGMIMPPDTKPVNRQVPGLIPPSQLKK